MRGVLTGMAFAVLAATPSMAGGVMEAEICAGCKGKPTIEQIETLLKEQNQYAKWPRWFMRKKVRARIDARAALLCDLRAKLAVESKPDALVDAARQTFALSEAMRMSYRVRGFGCSTGDTRIAGDGQPPPSRRRKDAGLPGLTVDLYGNVKAGTSLGRVNTADPVEGEILPIEVELDRFFDVSGWATKPESFGDVAVLNPKGDKGVTLLGGGSDLYVWSGAVAADIPLGTLALKAGEVVATVDRKVTLIRVPVDFGAKGRLNAEYGPLKFSGDIAPVTVGNTPLDETCPQATAETDNQTWDTDMITVQDSMGQNRCFIELKISDVPPVTPTLTVKLDDKAVEAATVEAYAGRFLKAKPPKVSTCTLDPILTAAAVERWSPPKPLAGGVFRCGVAKDTVRTTVVKQLSDGTLRIGADEVDLVRPTIQTIEVQLEAKGEPTTVYARTGTEVAEGSSSFGPRLPKGSVALKLRTVAEAAERSISPRSLGEVKALPAPPEVSSVQIHVGVLARDYARSIVFSGTVTPLWFPKAQERFLGRQGRWGKALIPVPSFGLRLALDNDDPLGLLMGVEFPVVPGLHVATGFELGTRHITETWQPGRAAYIGVTMAPATYDKLIKTVRERRAAKGK